MRLNVNRVVSEKSFDIVGMSYIGAPRSNTAMFITKKVEHLLSSLEEVRECLVFAESGIEVSDSLSEKHAFRFSDKPQLDYARFSNQFAEERFEEEKKLRVIHAQGGYSYTEDVVIPDDAYIEPGCMIGPDVQIGRNARILAGAVIRRAAIGDNFIANEHAVVGANGFTMAEDEDGNKIRIPTLGKVRIGNNVEIGSHNNISCGSGGDTVLDENVKLDSLIHVGHDVHLHRNVEVTAGVTIGGFVNAGEGAYIGVGAVLRNRINLGDHCFIGMGSNVTKSVDPGVVVAGNPAKPFVK